MKMVTGLFAAALASASIAAQAAVAEGTTATRWPARPIRLVVPASAGGPTDLIARVIGERIGTELRQTGVVENRPGAGGKIGLRLVAKAQPDGHAFVIGNPGPVAIVPNSETDVGYDVLKDFEPVAMLMRVPIQLVVRSEIPARSVAELVAYMRQQPKAITFGSSGEGQSPHMAAALFRNRTATNFLIVPYKGAAPAVADLVGGSIQALFDTTTAMPFIRDGRLRALAVGSGTRSSLFPNLPTMAESGFPGFEISSWYVLLAPARTPAEIVGRMNALVRSALDSKDVQEMLAKVNAETVPGTPRQAREFLAAELANWAGIVKLVAQGAPRE